MTPSITLASKKSKILLCIIVSNICFAAKNCSESQCVFSYKHNRCTLKRYNSISAVSTLLKDTIQFIKSVFSTCNIVDCCNCEVRKPGTLYCGYSTFISHVTVTR